MCTGVRKIENTNNNNYLKYHLTDIIRPKTCAHVLLYLLQVSDFRRLCNFKKTFQKKKNGLMFQP